MADSSPSIAADSPERRRVVWGYALTIAGSAFFATKGIFIKLAYGPESTALAVDAITILALRMAFSMPVYAAILAWAWRRQVIFGRPRPSARQTVTVIGLGLLGYYISSFTNFSGLQYITAQFERLILFTYPMFVMLLGALFFGARVSIWGVVSLAVSYAGIVLVYFRGDIALGENVMLGAGLVMTAAFCFALYQLLAKRALARVGGRLFTCIAMLSAGSGVLLHYAVQSLAGAAAYDLLALPVRVYWLAAGIAFFATILPSFMLNAGLERLGAQTVAMIGTLSPIYTILMATTLLGEPFALVDAAGTVLVIAGVGLYTLKARKA